MIEAFNRLWTKNSLPWSKYPMCALFKIIFQAYIFCFTVICSTGLANDREETLQAIQKIGGRVEFHLEQTDKVKGINLSACRATKNSIAALNELTQFPELEELNLSGLEIGDDDCKFMAKLPRLSQLVVDNTSVTGNFVQYLADQKQLKRLWAVNAPINDQGLKSICESATNLVALDLANSKITDNSICHLQHLTKLNYLNLNSVQLSNAVLPTITKLKTVDHFTLSDTKIDQQAFDLIASMSQLKRLYFGSADLRGIKLTKLNQLTNLDNLNLASTKITSDQFLELTPQDKLTFLSVQATECDDRCIPRIVQFKKLACIVIIESKITAETLRSALEYPDDVSVLK